VEGIVVRQDGGGKLKRRGNSQERGIRSATTTADSGTLVNGASRHPAPIVACAADRLDRLREFYLVIAIGLCGQMQKCQSQIFELDLVRFAPGKFQLVNADTRENIDWGNWPLGLINDIKTSRKKLAHRMWTVFGGRMRILA